MSQYILTHNTYLKNIDKNLLNQKISAFPSEKIKSVSSYKYNKYFDDSNINYKKLFNFLLYLIIFIIIFYLIYYLYIKINKVENKIDLLISNSI